MAFVAPDSFNVFLSITFLVGIVIGGLASMSGAIFGALFIQFVPNYAQEISKAAPWAIYGVFLIAFMYAMPDGVAGFLRRLARRIGGRASRPCPPRPSHPKGDNMHKRRSVLALTLSVVLGLLARPRWRRIRGSRPPRSRSATPTPTAGRPPPTGRSARSSAAYFKKVNEEGGINGRKINFITLDDGYSPPKTVEMVRKLVEQDQVLLLFQTLGTPSNTAIWKYMNDEQVPQLFVATGATKWGDPKGHPWTMGWQPTYQTEGHIYAQYILKNVPDAKIGILFQNDDYGKDYLKGIKDGLGAAAKKIDRARAVVRGHRPDRRLADREPEEQRRQRVLQRHDAEVRRPGDQEGGRHRLEADPPPEQRVRPRWAPS